MSPFLWGFLTGVAAMMTMSMLVLSFLIFAAKHEEPEEPKSTFMCHYEDCDFVVITNSNELVAWLAEDHEIYHKTKETPHVYQRRLESEVPDSGWNGDEDQGERTESHQASRTP